MISELRKDIPDGNGGYITVGNYLIIRIKNLPLYEEFTLNDLMKNYTSKVSNELGKEFAGLVQSGDLKGLLIVEKSPVMKYRKIDSEIWIDYVFHQVNPL